MDWSFPLSLESLLLAIAAALAVLWLVLWRVPGAARSRRMAWMGCALSMGLLLSRAWLVEPFFVPSASMAPTLLEGDVVLVQKFPYGLAWPVGEARMLEMGTPARGEVVVFTLPADPTTRYVKRVIGVAGDEVTWLDGTWFVNGQALPVEAAGPFADLRGGRRAQGWMRARQALAGQGFDIIQSPEPDAFVGHWRVPPGHLFVLGDNRGDSQDSRLIGFVPESLVVGRASRLLLNLKGLDRWGRPIHRSSDLPAP